MVKELARVKAYHAEPSQHADERRKRLERLLEYATESVPFYQEFDQSGGLAAFPVINKDTIREVPNDFLDPSIELSSLSKVTTSGSTGEPFTCYHDQVKRRRKHADLLYYNGIAGYEVGDMHLLMRATYVSRIKQWLLNQLWVNPTHWNDSLREGVRQRLLKKKVRVAIGYPSVFADVASYCATKRDSPSDFSIEAFISTSELLLPEQRDVIRSAFNCEAFSRYATEEFGVLGQASGDCERFELNTGSLIIEVLQTDSDKPVSSGEVGRVVVTDLDLFAMPMIRYDIGDLARVDRLSEDGYGVVTLSALEGKTAHVVHDTSGCRVAPLSVLVGLKGMDGLRHFQFAQVGRTAYELRVAPEQTTGEALAEDALRTIFGSDAIINTCKYQKIPTLPSGKTPIVVNEWIDDD